jgi:hypothetical protein
MAYIENILTITADFEIHASPKAAIFEIFSGQNLCRDCALLIRGEKAPYWKLSADAGFY